ncbi:MAG: DUF1186 domain-containing protein [Terracidiphilus sp.]|jgi:uncharacterized protein YchJ
MEIDEIIEQFEWFHGKFERDAVEAAVARRDEIIPELLAVLEEIANPEIAAELDADGDYMAHLYAMFLLAQFRETRAYPIMLRIALLPGDLLDSLFGDCITEHFGRVLASVCGGDLKGIQSLIENPVADEWVRGAGLGGLVTLIAAGIKSREEILSYFAELFRGKLTDKNDIVWSDLISYSTDLCASELIGEIERAYEQELVDPSILTLEDVRRDLAKGKDWAMERLADDPHRRLIEDTVKEMEGWASFNEKEPRKEPAKDAAIQRREDSPTGFKRAAPKIGRNDPCPCASGKKYKKCCGQ